MVMTSFTGVGVGIGAGIGCGFGIGWGFGGSSIQTLGLGIGGGCGIGVGLGWGNGAAAYGTRYFDPNITFEGVEFGKRNWLHFISTSLQRLGKRRQQLQPAETVRMHGEMVKPDGTIVTGSS